MNLFMHQFLGIIAEVALPESPATAEQSLTVPPESFWDPVSVVLCTAGLCVGIVWLFWFGGFRSLRKSPIRRCRQWLFYCPPAILIIWLTGISATQIIAPTELASYPANALLEIMLIAGMLWIAHRAFARKLKGLGIRFDGLISNAKWAAVNLLGTFPLILFGLWVTLVLGRLFSGPDFSLEVHQTLDTLADGSAGSQILIAIFTVLIVPVFEEILFRGFCQTSIRAMSNSPWAAIFLTSLFFAILHPPTHIPALFMLSAGLGYAYERSGSLLRPILMHVFFNGTSVAMTFLTAQ